MTTDNYWPKLDEHEITLWNLWLVILVKIEKSAPDQNSNSSLACPEISWNANSSKQNSNHQVDQKNMYVVCFSYMYGQGRKRFAIYICEIYIKNIEGILTTMFKLLKTDVLAYMYFGWLRLKQKLYHCSNPNVEIQNYFAKPSSECWLTVFPHQCVLQTNDCNDGIWKHP